MPAWLDGFVDAIDAGDAQYLACEECGESTLPPRTFCPACGERALVERPLSGPGTVVSFTEISVTSPKFDGETPYTIVLAAFEEGVRLGGQLRGAESVALGDTVTLGVEEHDDGNPIFTFEPEAADG